MESEKIYFYKLTVVTSDKAAEKIVLDSQFQPVRANSKNNSLFVLPKGLYTVKVKIGSQCQEKTIALHADETLNFEPIQFSSPAPIEGTARTNQDQIDESQALSHKTHTSIGSGSELYIFSRYCAQKGNPDNFISSGIHPMRGLSLLDKDGNLLLNFSKFADHNLQQLSQEPWAACNISVDPGIYQLDLEIPLSNSLHTTNLRQTVVVCAGWQTQLCMLQRNYGVKEQYFGADLAESSIFMSKIQQGFHSKMSTGYPNSADNRLIDSIRQALKNQRKILITDIIDTLLDKKFDNPMLGIYGAYLLMLSDKWDLDDLRTIVINLRSLLGNHHPDVEAIALKAEMQSDYKFNTFPMLVNSWKNVLEVSAKEPQIIIANSLPAKYTGGFWNSDLWLIWGKYNEEESNKALFEQLRKYRHQSAVFSESNIENSIKEGHNFRMGMEYRNVEGEDMRSNGLSFSDEINNEEILPIVQTFGIPRNKVEEILKDENLKKMYGLPEITKISTVETINEDEPDLQKGKWGGQPEHQDRKISARIEKSLLPKLYRVIITVGSTNANNPLKGTVKFHLHDSFLNPNPTVNVKDGQAVLTLRGVWGAFTVGAQSDGDRINLELDLAELKDAPKEFREK